MYEVVVVGAGYWGTAITLTLRQAGHEVLCLDSGQPGGASRVAAGLVRQTTLEGLNAPWWTTRHSQACQNFVQEPWMQSAEEDLISVYAPSPRRRGGLWLADSAGFLSLAQASHVQVKELRVEPGGWRLLCAGQAEIVCQTVVLATGYGSDALLAASGLPEFNITPSPGCAWVSPASQRLDRPVTLAYRLPGDTRTRTATVRNWTPGSHYAGSTTEPRSQEQLEKLSDLLSLSGSLGEATLLRGIRPVLPQFLVEQIRPGLVVATGGGRNGLASAAGVALQVLHTAF